MPLCGAVLCSAVRCGTVIIWKALLCHATVWCCAVQCCAVLYCAVHWRDVIWIALLCHASVLCCAVHRAAKGLAKTVTTYWHSIVQHCCMKLHDFELKLALVKLARNAVSKRTPHATYNYTITPTRCIRLASAWVKCCTITVLALNTHFALVTASAVHSLLTLSFRPNMAFGVVA